MMAISKVDITQFEAETGSWLQSVFFRRTVLEAYGPALKCFVMHSGRECVGGFVAFETTILGRKALITPPFFPNIGPLFRQSTGKTVVRNTMMKKQMTEWIDFMENSGYRVYEMVLPPEVSDMQPAIWSGLDVAVRYTYRLDLTQSETDIFAGYEDKLKADLRKALNGNVRQSSVIPNSENTSLIRAGLEGKSALKHVGIFNSFLQALAREEAHVAEVSDAMGHAAQALWVPGKSTAYYMFGGTSDSGKVIGAGPLSLHNAILGAKEKGVHVFDFEGSMISGVERYFRQFGGTLTPYYVVSKGMKTYQGLRKALGKI